MSRGSEWRGDRRERGSVRREGGSERGSERGGEGAVTDVLGQLSVHALRGER